jgi:O-antigen/teichoic acid export membrane protein
MFPIVYSDALSQPAANLARTDRAGFSRLLNRGASQLFVLGLPLSVGGFLLAEPIMATVFGPSYAVAGYAAGLLFLALALSFPARS